MKYKLTALFCACSLLIALPTSCAPQPVEDTTVFSLTSEQKEGYHDMIDKTLTSFYWRYLSDSIQYFEASIPTAAEAKATGIFEASKENGYDLTAHAGAECIIASASITHFNGDNGGIAYFYFIGNTLAGLYYTPPNFSTAYALTSRNAFLGPVEFANYESGEPQKEFVEVTSSIGLNGFSTVGKNARGETILGAVQDDSVNLYTYNNSIALYKSLENWAPLVPISITLLNEKSGTPGAAVLLGERRFTDGECTEGAVETAVSKQLVFFDQSFERLPYSLTLEEENYSYIFQDEEYIVIARDASLDYYQFRDGAMVNVSSFRIEHSISSINITDIDGDMIKEYIMTDGLDLYVYHRDFAGFSCLWRTHLSTESVTGSIYTGDLNQDKVKEIYVCDATGTAIRFVLTPKGLQSQNEDINFGDKIFSADFNEDGKDDYIKITEEAQTVQIGYIQK